MNKKILISLSVVVVVAAIAIGATTAFFSDTETSTGNTFTAGAIDLKVDSQQHYNGNVCVWEGGLTNGDGTQGAWVWSGPDSYPVPGTYCNGSWEATDLGVTNKFFDFADIKPGDSGEDTISLHVLNNDAWVCAEVSRLTNSDNGTTEPESTAVGQTSGGDLQNALVMTVWKDDGVGTDHTGKCDNIHQDGETILASGHPTNGVLPVYDTTTGNGALPGDSTTCLGVSWSLPLETGNEVQTDSLTGDISFNVVQSRNNADFRCSDSTQVPETHRVESPVLQFGSIGWGGWSCPAGETAVSGGTIGDTQTIAAQGLATANIDGQTYPVYPHYTFPSGETGYVVHNGAVGQSLQIFVDCQL